MNENSLLKPAIFLTHFISFLLLAGIAYMGFRGSINFNVSGATLVKYIPLGYVLSVIFLTVITSLMIISTEFIFSNNRKKFQIGSAFFLFESLFLAYCGSQISAYSTRGFGPICLYVGMASIALYAYMLTKERSISDSEAIHFRLEEFLKFPSWRKNIRSAIFIGLAAIFGGHLTYFGTSAFGILVGWSVQDALIGYQYPLQYEIRKGNIEKIKNLLNSGHSVNEKWYLNGKCMGTPIEAAVKHREEVIKLLLDRGSNLEACTQRSVHKMILEDYNSRNHKLFLELGLIKPNQMYSGEYPIIHILKRCLNTIKEVGVEPTLRLYLDYGADPNIDNGKPLYIAAKRNCVNSVRILIEKGADATKKYENEMTISELIDSKAWEKPVSHYLDFTDPLKALFKNKN